MEATRDATREGERAEHRPEPGLAVVFSGGAPVFATVPVGRAPIELGRQAFEGLGLDDDSVSRRHARVAFDGRRWSVTDHGSRNGTFVDGARVEGERVGAGLRVLRLGRSLLLLEPDLGPLAGGVDVGDTAVVGPRLRAAWAAIERAAAAGEVVHVTGETGAGKELAARRFHAAGPRPDGPFVAVNCAAIPEGLAERLLFGAVRGAYSGATADTTGYVQAADGGTLFLDEIGELDASVQGKLLRVLEAREVLPLGATKARPVALRVVSATHRDLRAAIAEGAFRQDLYFRVGRPDVRLPPLRERLEEIPHLLALALASVDPALTPSAGLVERALLAAWPGNARELLAEARRAATEARAAGRTSVLAEDLADSAGQAFEAPVPDERPAPDATEIEAALAAAAGNVAATARALGVHRTQLRRWIAKHGIDPRRFAPDA